jgi:hypothetical protein
VRTGEKRRLLRVEDIGGVITAIAPPESRAERAAASRPGKR